ncbi:MAG: DoxX family protein [Lewinella sp.]|jgi:hypothetical protein|uniref:DoxX family protein n=1 Tax=Lewinella sp. TaxID=2004506 RepID=UPI003D6BCF7A
MSRLHNPAIGKTRKIAGYILSVLPSLLIAFAGISKLAGLEEMVKNMENIGLGELTQFIGFLEIACLILYWIPKTSNIGFFLLCSYTGGIIVAELIGGGVPVPGIAVATLFYIGTMLRKPELSGLDL